jgi:hypothetical protein
LEEGIAATAASNPASAAFSGVQSCSVAFDGSQFKMNFETGTTVFVAFFFFLVVAMGHLLKNFIVNKK